MQRPPSMPLEALEANECSSEKRRPPVMSALEGVRVGGVLMLCGVSSGFPHPMPLAGGGVLMALDCSFPIDAPMLLTELSRQCPQCACGCALIAAFPAPAMLQEVEDVPESEATLPTEASKGAGAAAKDVCRKQSRKRAISSSCST